VLSILNRGLAHKYTAPFEEDGFAPACLISAYLMMLLGFCVCLYSILPQEPATASSPRITIRSEDVPSIFKLAPSFTFIPVPDPISIMTPGSIVTLLLIFNIGEELDTNLYGTPILWMVAGAVISDV